MISLSYFENSKEFTVSSYKELIALCTTLRVNNPKTPYTIYIKGKGNEIANIKFNFDYFRIISDDGYELDSTLYANMLDNEGNELTN